MSEAYITRRGGSGGGVIGATAKINDVVTWQKCAGIKSPVSAINTLLGNTRTLRTVFGNGNAMDYLKRSPDLLKAITGNRAAYKLILEYCKTTPIGWNDGAYGSVGETEWGTLKWGSGFKDGYFKGRTFMPYVNKMGSQAAGYYTYTQKPGADSWYSIDLGHSIVILKAIINFNYVARGDNIEVVMQGVDPSNNSVFDISNAITSHDTATDLDFGVPKVFRRTKEFRVLFKTGNTTPYHNGFRGWYI